MNNFSNSVENFSVKVLHYPLQVEVDAGQVWSQEELNDPVTVLVHKSAIFVLQKSKNG